MKSHQQYINDELLVKYLLGEASLADSSQVEDWISAASSNRIYFDHFKLIWDSSRKIILPLAVNEDAAWERFQERKRQARLNKTIVRSMNKFFPWMRVAVLLVLSIGALALSYFIWNNGNPGQILITSGDSIRLNTLPDGSIVTLNRSTSISYSKKFKGKQRKVELTGEAFFSVIPDKNKPFVVTINDIKVSVIGTSFNIKNADGKTEIVVESGKVIVTRNNKTVELQRKEKVVLHDADTAFAKVKSTDILYNYYRSRKFVCDNTPLWRLVETLNEAYNSNIVIESADLRGLPLTATFYNEPLENILIVISKTFDITVIRDGKKIILK